MRIGELPDHLQGAIHLDIALRNARRIASRKWAKAPNWVLAMDTFGLGSTYAFELCRKLGFDPESKVTEPQP